MLTVLICVLIGYLIFGGLGALIGLLIGLLLVGFPA